MNVNKMENRIALKFKSGYYLEPLRLEIQNSESSDI